MLSVPFDVWLAGIGPGLFEDVFQTIKPSYFSVRFIYAHNDYLEFFFEFGLIFGLLIILAIAFWFWRIYPFSSEHVLKAGIYGSVAAVGLHSLVDFNLQIPGAALFFWFVVGLLVNPKMASHIENDEPITSSKKRAKKTFNLSLPKTKREWLAFLRSD